MKCCMIPEFSRDELMKLLKGLHYSMWMQDKPLIQVNPMSYCPYLYMDTLFMLACVLNKAYEVVYIT